MAQKRNTVQHAVVLPPELIASIGDGVIVVDPRLKVTEANAQAVEMLHKRKSTMVGHPVWRFLDIRDAKGKKTHNTVRIAIGKLLHKARANKRKVPPMTLPPVYVKFPGLGVLPYAFTLSLIQNQYGTVQGAVLSFRDISTDVEVGNMKSEFVSLAAHQLRAPLTSIRWNIEMLLRGEIGPVPETQQELLHDIYASNGRMLTLVNDLLNVSRLESGRIRVEPLPVDLVATAQDIKKELEGETRVGKVSVAVERDASVKEGEKVSVDPGLIHEIIKNFTANAIKYTPEGGKVTVRVSSDGKRYRVSVIDTGMGISKKEQTKIFTKFFRAANAADKDPLGSGLGLYMVKMLAGALGGKVGFRSKEGEGSEFFVTIPHKGSPKNLHGKPYSSLTLKSS